MGLINTNYSIQSNQSIETQPATEPAKKYDISPPCNCLTDQESARPLHNRVTISDRSSSTTIKTMSVGNGLFLVSINNVKHAIITEATLRQEIQALRNIALDPWTDTTKRVLAFQLMLEVMPVNFTFDFKDNIKDELGLLLFRNLQSKPEDKFYEESDFRIVVGEEQIEEKPKTPEPFVQNYTNLVYPFRTELLDPRVKVESSKTASTELDAPSPSAPEFEEEDEEEEYERPLAFNPNFRSHLPKLGEEELAPPTAYNPNRKKHS